jgi:hypothetical protein
VLENVLVGCHSRFRAGFAKTLFRMPGFRREERAAQAEARQLLGIVGLSDFARRTGAQPTRLRTAGSESSRGMQLPVWRENKAHPSCGPKV